MNLILLLFELISMCLTFMLYFYILNESGIFIAIGFLSSITLIKFFIDKIFRKDEEKNEKNKF